MIVITLKKTAAIKQRAGSQQPPPYDAGGMEDTCGTRHYILQHVQSLLLFKVNDTTRQSYFYKYHFQILPANDGHVLKAWLFPSASTLPTE